MYNTEECSLHLYCFFLKLNKIHVKNKKFWETEVPKKNSPLDSTQSKTNKMSTSKSETVSLAPGSVPATE